MNIKPSDSPLVAVVAAELPQRLYRLTSEDGTTIFAGPSQEAKRLGMVLTAGQHVLVRRARLDPSRGIIVGFASSTGPGQRDEQSHES